MNILHLEKQRRMTGQTQCVLREMVALKERGHELFLACRTGAALGREAAKEGIKVAQIQMKGAALYLAAFTLRSHINRWGIDVVHAHGARDHLLGALALLGARRTALLRTKHNIVPLRGGAFSRYLYGRVTHRLVSVSEAAKGYLIDDGIAADHIDVVYDGIDCERFSPRPEDERLRAELGLDPSHQLIGIAGRIGSSSLDVGTAIAAMARLAPDYPNARLVLAGRGDDRAERMRRKMDIADRVILAGFQDDMPSLMSLFSIYLQPNTKAALGTSVIEAQAMGIPTVGTGVGGQGEIIEDGATGLLCPMKDPDAMAGVLARLLDDGALRARMSEAARLRALALFDEKDTGRHLEEVYGRALKCVR